MPQTPERKKLYRNISVEVPKEIAERFDAYCDSRKMTKSQMIRKWIAVAISAKDDEEQC